MTLETLRAANTLYSKITNLESRLSQLQNMADEAKGVTVTARVKGIDIELPKATFRVPVLAKKTALESELSALQAEFNAL